MASTLFRPQPVMIGCWDVGNKLPITALAAGPGPNNVAVAYGHNAKVMEYVQSGAVANLMCYGAEVSKTYDKITSVSVGSDMLACGLARSAHNHKAIDALTLELGPGARVDTYLKVNDNNSDSESDRPERLRCRPRGLKRHTDWVSGIAEQLVDDGVMLDEGERLPLATSSHDNSVVLWDMQTNNKERGIARLLAAEPGNLTCVSWAFAFDGAEAADHVVAGSTNGCLYVWHNALDLADSDDDSRKRVNGLRIDDSEIVCLAAHPYLPQIAVGTRNGVVALVQITVDGARVTNCTSGAGSIKAISWNVEGSMFVVARNLQQRRSAYQTADVSFATVSDKTPGDSSVLEFYDLDLTLQHRFTKKGPSITAVAWSRKFSSRNIFAGTDNGNVTLLAF